MRKRVRPSGKPVARPLPPPIRNSPEPKVSVIIPAMNECRTIARVIRAAGDVHPATEVIVVANGSTDATPDIAEKMGAKVIRYADPLGHDVGRSIGALEARGDILLFTDGDIVIPANQLLPFVEAVEQGIDVALNRYEGAVRRKTVHSVVLAKSVLSAIIGSELGASSLTAIPHALSRRALEAIGAEQLAVPPKAQAIAIRKGLCIAAAAYVEVGRSNPRRRRPDGSVKKLILGDHLEAIHWLLVEQGDSRANKPDLGRQRERVRAEL